MNVSVLIASYGAGSWGQLAQRAEASALALDPPAYEVLVAHEPDGTLASVRNGLAARATGDWLCFLDADDELHPRYLDHMDAAHRSEVRVLENGDGSWREELSARALLAPAVQYVTASGARYRPRIPDKRHCGGDIRRGSWLVIGTLVPRAAFLDAGGFRDYPMYEDWALFAACWKAGCQIVEVPDAVYVAHVRPASRNRGNDRAARLAAHARITADLFPELAPPA